MDFDKAKKEVNTLLTSIYGDGVFSCSSSKIQHIQTLPLKKVEGVYVELFRIFLNFHHCEDETKEGVFADFLRDELDVFWYGLNDPRRPLINAGLYEDNYE